MSAAIGEAGLALREAVTSATGQARKILASTLADNAFDIFAVLDAAHFDDVRPRLDAPGLPRFRALYRDEEDGEEAPAGPLLLQPRTLAALDHLLTLNAETPCVVFWVWPARSGSAGAAIRHLRGLGLIEIPKDREDNDSEDLDGLESVVFRHADPRTLAAVIPVLTKEQSAQLFGPARGLVAVIPGAATPVVFRAPDGNMWDGKRRPLRLNVDQYAAVAESHWRRMVSEIETELWEDRTKIIPQCDRGAFAKNVRTVCTDGRALGLRGKATLLNWTRMNVQAGERLAQTAYLAQFIVSGDGTPNDRLMLLDLMIKAGEKRRTERASVT